MSELDTTVHRMGDFLVLQPPSTVLHSDIASLQTSIFCTHIADHMELSRGVPTMSGTVAKALTACSPGSSSAAHFPFWDGAFYNMTGASDYVDDCTSLWPCVRLWDCMLCVGQLWGS